MGQYIFDQYSLLHFAVGIIAYFWSIDIVLLFLLHAVFEISENTDIGMKFINDYIYLWPGGKPKADSVINQIGDTISSLFGWYVAYYVDNIGIKYEWYEPHIK